MEELLTPFEEEMDSKWKLILEIKLSYSELTESCNQKVLQKIPVWHDVSKGDFNIHLWIYANYTD